MARQKGCGPQAAMVIIYGDAARERNFPKLLLQNDYYSAGVTRCHTSMSGSLRSRS